MLKEHGEIKVNGTSISLTIAAKDREKTEELFMAYKHAQIRLIEHLEQQGFVMVTHSPDK